MTKGAPHSGVTLVIDEDCAGLGEPDGGCVLEQADGASGLDVLAGHAPQAAPLSASTVSTLVTHEDQAVLVCGDCGADGLGQVLDSSS